MCAIRARPAGDGELAILPAHLSILLLTHGLLLRRGTIITSHLLTLFTSSHIPRGPAVHLSLLELWGQSQLFLDDRQNRAGRTGDLSGLGMPRARSRGARADACHRLLPHALKIGPRSLPQDPLAQHRAKDAQSVQAQRQAPGPAVPSL